MDLKRDDILRNLSIGAAAAIPYVGGSLAYIMDKKVPEQISSRYMSFIETLERDINSIEKEISYARFETPQFYSMFVKVINEIISDHIEEKRIIYENILINTVDSSWNLSKNEFFFSITSNLSTDAIRYLFLIYFKVLKKADNSKISLVAGLADTLPNQKNYIYSFASELVRFQLITGIALTEFGKEYCDFVFSPILLKDIKITD